MSADTVPGAFPDRPIRPLPKRRLRERLSLEAADSIEYPPLPPSTTPLFYYPSISKEEDIEPAGVTNRERGAVSIEGGYIARSVGDQGGDGNARGAVGRRSSLGPTSRSRQGPGQVHSRLQNAQAPPSADSSADGYDSFENTNNKKKRKIPTTGDLSLNGSHSLNEGTGASSPSSDFHADGSGVVSTPYYGSGSFMAGSPGISGPGRGRYGRSRNGRSPLRTLSDASNNWAGRNGKFRPPQWAMQTGEKPGIISSAIANAEKIPSQNGQENISLLQQRQLLARASPASSQFTFTCDFQVPGNLTWPAPDHRSSLPPGHPTDALQPQWVQDRLVGKDAAAGRQQPANTISQAPNGQAGTGKKKMGRRKLQAELQKQARDRQQGQTSKNYENPPKDGEDPYLCPYCEFELIVGYKPRALIHDFEMKERKKRLEEERRRRLIDKAKARGRKGRKAKAPNKSAQGADAQATAEQQAPPMQPNPSQETRSEGYDEEEYDGEDPGEGRGDGAPAATKPAGNVSAHSRATRDEGRYPGGGTGGPAGKT